MPAQHRIGKFGMVRLLAAAAVGVVCALVGQAVVVGSEPVCNETLGTPDCGKVGILLLLGTLALLAFIGTKLFALLRIAQPGVSSVLGLCLFAIVIMTLLLDVVSSPYMWLVLPVVAAFTYALGAWLARRLARTRAQW